ncbi:hypothetical protein GCM10025867_32550 [Frondihabitans sucicola]|uniref:Uncharacterized protein n=1 Tax=Frondihabitans sucicola TaxID=1268041 RepID=A0ABM8GRU0_9MICO|nr:hypothetical protein GCM10025867_32550 [Frondihabitans sucicola]
MPVMTVDRCVFFTESPFAKETFGSASRAPETVTAFDADPAAGAEHELFASLLAVGVDVEDPEVHPARASARTGTRARDARQRGRRIEDFRVGNGVDPVLPTFQAASWVCVKAAPSA